MNIKTQKGKMYAVTSGGDCTVSLENGMILCSVTNGGQAYFVAPETTVIISDSTAIVTPCQDFSAAPAAVQGGGVSMTIDAEYDATSAHAQAGTAVRGAFVTYRFNVGQAGFSWGTSATSETVNSIAVGANAKAWGTGVAMASSTSARSTCVAVGDAAQASATSSIAIGHLAVAHNGGVALGREASVKDVSENGIAIGRQAKTEASQAIAVGRLANSKAALATALGYAAKVADAGVCCIAAWNSADKTLQTLLYLIGSGSALATTYEAGAASLGYVVKAVTGSILECGTVKLRDLLPNNTAFAPAGMDLDAPAPSPFLPTGIMEPLVLGEDEATSPQA